VWLVFLELTVLHFVMTFSLVKGLVFLSILWALGWAMGALCLLGHIPVRTMAVLSIGVIVSHNLADAVRASQFGAAAPVWNILHQPGVFRVDGALVLARYAVV